MKGLHSILMEVIEDLRSIGINAQEPEELRINTRLSTSMGRCIRSTGKKNQFLIELNPRLLQQGDTQMLKDVMAHELIHTLPACFDHSVVFQTVAGLLNESGLGYNVHVRYDPNLYQSGGIRIERTPRYVLECLRCKKRFYRTRWCSSIEHPENYRCRCGGNMKRIR